MLKLITVALFTYIVLRSNVRRKKGWVNPSTFLIGMFSAAALLGIPHVLINGGSNTAQYSLLLDQTKYWAGTFAYLFFWILFMFPILYFRENKTEEIQIPNISVLDMFSNVLILLSLYSILFYLPSVINMFRSGTALMYLRNNLSTTRAEFVNTGGIGNTIASVASSMYPFAIMLFFIYYIIGKHPVRCALLFISSTSNIIHVLSFVGRDGVVFWLVEFAVMYILFRNYFNQKQRGKIKRVFFVGAICAIIPFVLISISRFGSGDKQYGTIKGILSYMGQMVPNYLLYFDVRGQHYEYGSSFPLYWELTGRSAPSTSRWIDGGTESNVFGTFIKSYNINFGLLGTLFVGVIVAVVFILILRRERKTISYHHYFIYILYFEVLSEGLFYFRQSTRGGNLFIILCFFLYAIFGFVERHFGSFQLSIREDVEEINRPKVKFILRRH